MEMKNWSTSGTRHKKINLQQPISRTGLSRALFQALFPDQPPDQEKIKAARFIIEQAIKNGDLKPSPGAIDTFDLSDLIGFARNREWKRTLIGFNSPLKKYAAERKHGAKIDISTTKKPGSSRKRPIKNKSRKLPVRQEKFIAAATGAVGIPFVSIDDTQYPSSYAELLALAKARHAEIETLKAERDALRGEIEQMKSKAT